MTIKLNARFCTAALGSVMAFSLLAPTPAVAQSEPFLGQLMLFGGNFCPRGWAQADGQLVAISQNQALYSLLGNVYGGDGSITFALPDLRGRAPIHQGQGPGLANYIEGQPGGAESITVTINNMPPHNHLMQGTNAIGDKLGPGSDFLASTASNAQYHDGPPNRTMDPAAITHTGGGQPIQYRSPYLVMMWCIAMEGIYPPRP